MRPPTIEGNIMKAITKAKKTVKKTMLYALAFVILATLFSTYSAMTVIENM
jgi:hypothetical protein